MKTLEDILTQHPFLNDLPPQYFPLLIECAVIERFGPGEQIFKKGYDAEHFYLIHHGKVDLESAYVPGEGFITIQTLGAGEALGWSWLFPPHQWQFSARAVADRSRRLQGGCLAEESERNPRFRIRSCPAGGRHNVETVASHSKTALGYLRGVTVIVTPVAFIALLQTDLSKHGWKPANSRRISDLRSLAVLNQSKGFFSQSMSASTKGKHATLLRSCFLQSTGRKFVIVPSRIFKACI